MNEKFRAKLLALLWEQAKDLNFGEISDITGKLCEKFQLELHIARRTKILKAGPQDRPRI